MKESLIIKNFKIEYGKIILNASYDGISFNKIRYKKRKDSLSNLCCFFKDFAKGEFYIYYHCSRCKFFYVYYKICDSHKVWFKDYVLKTCYIKPFTLLFYHIWQHERNESGYYLLNVNSWGCDYNYLVNYRIYKYFYRLLTLTIDKPIQKYAAFVKSKYAYINFKTKFTFYPISYKELKNSKFNYKKLQNKYKYYNTFYNKFEILTIDILDFISSHVIFLTDIEYKYYYKKVYALCKLSDIRLQNYLLGLRNRAYRKYEIYKLKKLKKGCGLYVNTRRSQRRVDNAFLNLIKQYKRCYKS